MKVKEFKLGRLRAQVFENAGDAGPWFNVLVDRAYEDGGQVKHALSMGRDDLLPAAELYRAAYIWVANQEARARAGAEVPRGSCP